MISHTSQLSRCVVVASSNSVLERPSINHCFSHVDVVQYSIVVDRNLPGTGSSVGQSRVIQRNDLHFLLRVAIAVQLQHKTFSFFSFLK